MTDTTELIRALAKVPYAARSETPIWQQIAERLRAACQDGVLAASARLPGEIQMAETFGVTRVTMRRALTRLQQEGLLQARKGVGIFVRPVPVRYRVDHRRQFIDGLDPGQQPGMRTLRLSRDVATDEEARELALAPNAPVIRLLRLRLVNDLPFYIGDKVFPGARFPGFEAAYEARHSVRDVFVAHGIPDYRRSETRVSGGFATALEAEALGLTPRTPVLRNQSLNADGTGAVIEFNRGTWPLTAVELVLRDT